VRAEDRTAVIRFSGIPRERFDDVAGLDRAKRRLAQVLRWLKQPGTLGAFGVKPPTGFLLAGPPGTGKTLLARALAGEADLPFVALSAGELKTKWLGESEQRIRDLFAMARRYAPAIVFIDEIDAVGGIRGRTPDHPWRDDVLNELLAGLDGFRSTDRPVFVLGATNRPDHLDPALRRPGRFDETIPIDLPNAKARRAFFERRLASVAHEEPLELERLLGGTSGCTPAQLDRIVREAVYLAAGEGRRAIRAADLEAARRLVRFGAQKEDVEVRPEELRLTARHEAAHALVHAVLFPDRPIDYLTIVPSESGALGLVAPLRDETRHDVRREDVRRQLAVFLAGRESELLTGAAEDALTAGASSDLEKATVLAYRAIGEWGFDEAFGLASLAGMPATVRGAFEARLLERLPEWLAQGRATARRILEEKSATLDALAEALLASESLDGEDLVRILNPSR
jgi:ATP-dependent metalloprotease FtsH